MDRDRDASPEEREEPRPELGFDPGEIAPHVASPWEDAELTDRERAQLKALVDLIGHKDVAARRWEVESCWERRLFARGYQYLLPIKGGGWIYPPMASTYSPTGRRGGRNFYGYETNIFSTYGGIVVAAMTRDVPGVVWRPQDPFSDADKTACDSSARYARVFRSLNALKDVQTQLAWYFWTDDRVLLVVDHVLDAQRFGRHDPAEDNPITPETEEDRGAFPLYVMRHGETELNVEDRMRGRSTAPLDDKGERQVSRGAQWLKDKGIALVISSPVERSLESATEVARILGVPVEVDDRLSSLDIGDLQEQEKGGEDNPIHEFFEHPDDRIPGSTESPNEFDDRVRSVLMDYLVRPGGGGCLFVSHDSVVSSIFRQLRGGDMPPSSLVAPGGIAGVRQGGDGVPEIVALYPSVRPEGSTGQTRGAPRGQETVTAYGKLEHRVPMGVDRQCDMTFIRVDEEIDVALAKAECPKYADQIRPGGGGSGENELDRIARINTKLALQASYVTGDSLVRDVTRTWVWLRPAHFMECADREMRESFFNKFPDGCKVTLYGDFLTSARNEAMDDHCCVVHANPGCGQNRLALGDPMMSLQKRLNTWMDLLDAYFTKTVPATWVPQGIVNIEAISGSRSPGDYLPYQYKQVPQGYTLEQMMRAEQLPLNNPAMPEMIMYFIQQLPQLIAHASPALFGSESNVDAWRGVAIQRDQALEANSTPWGHVQSAWAWVFRAAAQLAGRCRSEAVTGEDESGNALRIEISDLKGNVLCFPESDANFPESWIQRQSRYQQMIVDAATNPFMTKILSSLSNAKLAKDMAGFEDLAVPGADGYEKQMGELEILCKSGPQPNPAKLQLQAQIAQLNQSIAGIHALNTAVPDEQVAMLAQMQQQEAAMPDLVSTVPIDQNYDDHPAEFQACVDFVNSERGRRMANGSAEERAAIANIKIHGMQHKALIPPPQPQIKAPSMSINYKDLPSDVAAQALNEYGFQASGADVAQSKEFNEMVKRTGKAGQPVTPQQQMMMKGVQ